MATSSLANSSYKPPKVARKSSTGSTVAGRNPNVGFTPGGGAERIPVWKQPAKTSGITGTRNQQVASAAAEADRDAVTRTLRPASTGAPLAQPAFLKGTYDDSPQGQAALPGDPWTGFAQRYAPDYADLLLSNPTQVLYDTAIAMGAMQPGGEMGAVQSLAPYGDLLPVFYSLFNSQAPNFGSREAQVNFINEFGRNLLTPGGRDISLQGINSAIFGNPAVQELYRTGNPTENVNTLNDLIGMNAGLSFNPFLQRMVQAAQDRAAYEYLSAYSQGQNPGNYDEWLTNRYGGSVGSFFG